MTDQLPWIQGQADGVLLRLHLQPGARKTEVVGLHGDCLKVRIHAPPVEGKANEELVRFLAAILGYPKSAICIVAGENSRQKRILVVQASAGEVPDMVSKLSPEPAP